MSSSPLAHVSPASAAGILFQVHRVLTRLAQEPAAARVGFEIFDDLAVEAINGTLTVEQNKFSAAATPLTDSSVSIWNTLSNWIAVVRSMTPGERAGARFCIVTNTPSPTQSPLVMQLSRPRKTATEVADCLRAMEAMRVRRAATAVKQPRPLSGPTTVKPAKPDYIDLVMAAHAADRECVVRQMAIAFAADPVPTAAHQELSCALLLAPDENGDQILNAMLGWLSTRLLAKISKREDAWINRSDFARALRECRLNPRAEAAIMRGSSAIRPEERAAVPANSGTPLFVQRLEEIGSGKEPIVEATRRYLDHHAELIHLSRTGAIVTVLGAPEESHDGQFYAELEDRWRSVYGELHEPDGIADPPGTGRRVLRESMSRGRAQALRIGRVAVDREYFLEGGYHALANRDVPAREVWWKADTPLPSPDAPRGRRGAGS